MLFADDRFDTVDIERMVVEALDSGPKSFIGIRLWIERHKTEFLYDEQISDALVALQLRGEVRGQFLDDISKIDEVVEGPRRGHGVLYSLVARDHQPWTPD